jgi:hypothetical protein
MPKQKNLAIKSIIMNEWVEMSSSSIQKDIEERKM